MKLKVSFTAILFMSCCLFLTVGCQQKKQGSDDKSVPQAIQKVIQIKYPGATITDYDKDAAGVEVDIKDKGVKKEVLLGKIRYPCRRCPRRHHGQPNKFGLS